MERLTEIYSHIQSWICTLIIFIASFLGEAADWILFIYFITTVDLIVAIIKSVKLGKGILSNKLTKFLGKITLYTVLFLASTMLDKVINFEGSWFTRIYASIVLFSEIWSISGNALIINPNIPVLKLLKSILKSEIESKLNINLDKIEDKEDKHEENN